MDVLNNKLVLDSSVALKWFLDEEDSEKALGLRARMRDPLFETWVPIHFYFEVANVLTVKMPAFTTEFVSMLKAEGYQEMHMNWDVLGRAVKIIQKYPKCSLYDAYYHALAIVLKGTFLTADRKYFSFAQTEGHIALFQNWQP